MLRKILPAAFLLFVSNIASAQKVNLSLKTGTTYSYLSSLQLSSFSPTVSISGACKVLNGLQAGIEMSVYKIQFRQYGISEDYLNPDYQTYSRKVKTESSVFTANVFANILLNTSKHLSVYAGASGGYATTLHSGEAFIKKSVPGDGYVTGMQAGAIWHISKYIAANIELGAQKLSLKANGYADYNASVSKQAYSQWNFPAKAGLTIGL